MRSATMNQRTRPVLAACLLALMVVAPCASAQVQKQTTAVTCPPNQPNCSAQSIAAQEAQATFDSIAPPQIDVTDGGENGGGIVHLNGTAIDANKLIPGADQTKGAALQTTSTAGGTLDAVHAATDAQAQQDKTDNTLNGQAWVTAQRAAKNSVEQTKSMQQDNAFWTNSLNAVGQAQAGNAAGLPVGSCTTSSTTQPVPTTYYTTTEQVCDVIQAPSDAPVCTRAFQWQSGQSAQQQQQSANLGVDTESSGPECERQVTATGSTTTVPESKIVPLAYPQETGGAMCTRERWPVTQPALVPAQITALVAIDTEMSGQVCSRQRWVTETSSNVSGSHDGTLTIDTVTSGNVCSRTRTPTATTTTVTQSQNANLNINTTPTTTVDGNDWQWPTTGTTLTAGTASGDLAVDDGQSGRICTRTIKPTTTKTTVPGTSSADLTVNTEASGNVCTRTLTPTQSTVEKTGSQSAKLAVDTTQSGQVCARQDWPSVTTTTTPGSANVTLTPFPVGSSGVLETLQRWPTQTAGPPPQITTPATNQVGKTGFSYDPTGASSGTLSYDLSAIVPPGAQTISNFAITTVCSDGQTGLLHQYMYSQIPCTDPVSNLAMHVVVSQAPSASNHWVAVFSWSTTRTASPSFLYEIAINATWKVPSFTAAQSGSYSTQQTMGPVNSGGSTTLYLASAIGNATSISNLSVSVTCGGFLQTALPCGEKLDSNGNVVGAPVMFAVTITQQPTVANGWATGVSFRPLNTCVYCAGSTRMNFTAQWLQSTATTLDWALNTTPGSAQEGQAPTCKTTWACSLNAPATVNGVSVTLAMASALGPLFPGAGPYCLTAKESQTCSGSQTVSTNVDISADLPANTKTVSGFAFTVSNPQPGITVALVTAPTAANYWVARFSITKSSWTVATVAPQLALRWSSVQNVVSWTVNTTGNCSAPTDNNCPSSWACSQSAPAVVNGVSVTTGMAAALAPLYPSADSTCLAGNLSTACTGNANSTTTVSIASKIPTGTTAIDNFAFTVANQQSGITVVLASAPTLANHWVATFTVTRVEWASVPAGPQVNLTWGVPSIVVNVSPQDSGNCNDPGDATCPTAWSCKTNAPTTINGLAVTAAMAQAYAPLFPGATTSCAIGNLKATCAGTAVDSTTVSIANQLPPATTSLTGFTFAVSNPQAGIVVQLSSAPTLANGWVATFKVTRRTWGTVPTAPHITMNWTANVAGETASVVDTGNCAGGVSNSCTTSWACTVTAPATINGSPVSAAMAGQFAPLYPGALADCATGVVTGKCTGNGSTITGVSIANQLPDGTTSLQNFAYTVTNPQAGVAVTLNQAPTAANGWTASFAVSRSAWTILPAAPHVQLTWNAGHPTVSFAIQSSGDITTTGTTSCPATWSCTKTAPATVNGIAVTDAMLAGQAVLYPGASTTCLNAQLISTCIAPLVTQTAVSIAAQLPAGTSTINNFSFQITNPQPGVSIAQIQEPLASNSWVARFRVTREGWVTAPVRPKIAMSWQALQTTYTFANVDTGKCNATSVAHCPVAWSCTTAPPATINNIDVTAAMVAGLPPLFTGDTATCLVGSLDRSCSGTATSVTTISIASDLPAGTTAINGVAFTVSNEQAGVVVTMAGAPTAANNWVATFRVVKSLWSVVVAAPQVHITWTVTEPTYSYTAVDTGDCNATGDSACPVSWSCAASAPATINGIPVTPTMLSGATPLYLSADAACVTANLDATCGGSSTTSARSLVHAIARATTADTGGSGVTTSPVDVSSKIPAGTTAISNVTLTVNNPQPGVTVALVTLPSLANNWVATVQTTRTDFSYVPVQPSVTIAFDFDQSTVSFSVQDTGDCGGAGTSHCPPVWSCTGSAPTTINGIAVTPSMVSGLPALFSGAAPACTSGALAATCSGTDTASSTISIADAIPSGVTSISNFAFKVNNPQPGILAVTLTQTPSASNQWVAIFAVKRNYSNGPAQQPMVTLTWGAEEGTFALTTSDTGTCSTTTTASCGINWTCKTQVPATIDGAQVTSAMLSAAGIRLYPGDTNDTCVDANLSRVCAGDGSTTTQVSIAAQLPSGTLTISNFAWSVSTTQPGVIVSLVTAPSLANQWVATFATTRSDWSTAPTGQPAVTMTWSVSTGQGQGLVAVDSGNCGITGDAYCSTQWMCTAYASTTPTGGGTSETDVPGHIHESLLGTPSGISVSVSIAAKLPAGTATLTSVAWDEVDLGGGGNCGPVQCAPTTGAPQASTQASGDASATLIDLPTLANNWTATFSVVSSCVSPAAGGYCTPATGFLTWIAVIPGTGGSAPPPSGSITTGDLVGVPPIYPGAPANCIAAQKAYQCSTINNGTVCHTTDTGEQVCETVTGGAFNGCGALQADPTCTLARTVCTDGATSATGFCYIQNNVYECKTPISGSDTGVTTTTTCNMNLPVCTTAGCSQSYSDTTTRSAGSAAHAVANLAIIEDINSDYVDANPGTGPGGGGCPGCGGGSPGGPGGGVIQAALKGAVGKARASAKTADSSLPDGSWTPWTGQTGSITPSDPSQAPGASAPPGWNPALMTWFNGNQMSCYKDLGGLLNCCNKQAPVDGNVAWWQTYQSQLRSGWAGVASCSAAPAGSTPPPGGWSTSNGNASMTSVSQGFTSALENLTGNGVIPACQTAGNQSMQNVEQSFENYAQANIIPKLAWYCNNNEKTLAVRNRLSECHYIGDYCKTSILGFCLDKRQEYCCFNSPMSKMLREQLDSQGVLGFGTAKSPSCGGASIAQLQSMNTSSMDTTSLEGNMVEAGAVPDVSTLLGPNFIQQFTGSGSKIGNAGRQDLTTRTAARVAQVQTTDAVNALVTQTEAFVPDQSSIAQPTAGPGDITVQDATVNVTRGNWFDVILTRSGGVGAVAVQVTAVAGTAASAIDYAFAPNPQTVAWGAGDTSTRHIRVYTYAPMPAVTVPRSFEIHLSNPTGGAVLYPTAIQQITIVPKP